jgi:hypothetical protein
MVQRCVFHSSDPTLTFRNTKAVICPGRKIEDVQCQTLMVRHTEEAEILNWKETDRHCDSEVAVQLQMSIKETFPLEVCG